MNKKKKILISGATSGIGEALFHQYVRHGNDVIACGRNQQKLLELSSTAYKVLKFDVNNMEQIQQSGKEIEHLDLLILNAGDCRYIDDVLSFDSQLFEQVIQTNLISLGRLLEVFLPKMKSGGRIVFISSSATILPFPKAQAYGSSKAGVDYLANSLRLDLLPYNIGVTLVHPGFVKTPLTDKNTFSMPFMIDSQQAAKRIYDGVKAKKHYLQFPKRLTLVMKFLSVMPSSLWQKLILRAN